MFFWFLISIHDGVYTEETLTFLVKTDSSLRQCILTTVFPSSTPLSPLSSSLSPGYTPSLFPLQNEVGLQRTAVKQDKTRYNRKRRKHFILRLDKAIHKEEKSPQSRKTESKNTPASAVWSPTKPPS